MSTSDECGTGRPVVAVVARGACVLCCACRNACTGGAIDIMAAVLVDEDRCDGCGECIDVCVPGALRLESRDVPPAVQSPHETPQSARGSA